MKQVDQSTGEDLNPSEERRVRVVEDDDEPQPGPSSRRGIEGLGQFEDVDQDVDNKRRVNK